MKYLHYVALIASAKAADELLVGSVACTAGSQTVKYYDDAACATEAADQTAATSTEGVIDAGTNGYQNLKCHKLGIVYDTAGV